MRPRWRVPEATNRKGPAHDGNLLVVSPFSFAAILDTARGSSQADLFWAWLVVLSVPPTALAAGILSLWRRTHPNLSLSDA